MEAGGGEGGGRRGIITSRKIGGYNRGNEEIKMEKGRGLPRSNS